MKHTTLALTCALTLFAFSGKVWAGTSEIWDTSALTTVTQNSQPSIHGTSLVWQAKGGLANTVSPQNDWEIFASDMMTGTVVQLTDNAFDDTLPKTDGTFAVWQQYIPGSSKQIFLYRLNGSNPAGGTQISPVDEGNHFSPDIAEGIVIWSRQYVDQSFSPREILLYNTQTQDGPIVISNPTYNSSSPRIANNEIAFLQEDAEGDETLVLYNVTDKNPQAKPAPKVFSWQANPQVDGAQTVLSRYNGSDREIFLHNRTDGYIQITDNSLSDLSPTINQNHVAWVRNKNIYLSDIADFIHVQVPDNSTGRGTGFLATWSALSGGVDAYYLDVSTDPDFQSFVNGYRALDVSTVTQYWVDGLQPDTTYYYRVYASVNGSTTALSKSVPVKVFAPSSPPPTGSMAIPFIYKLLL